MKEDFLRRFKCHIRKLFLKYLHIWMDNKEIEISPFLNIPLYLVYYLKKRVKETTVCIILNIQHRFDSSELVLTLSECSVLSPALLVLPTQRPVGL